METSLRLKLFRISAGLKQSDVAKALRVSSDFVSMLERGKRDPTLRYLKEFAKLVKIPLSIMFWDPDESEHRSAGEQRIHKEIEGLIMELSHRFGVC